LNFGEERVEFMGRGDLLGMAELLFELGLETGVL
jgi:hypothetical protein